MRFGIVLEGVRHRFTSERWLWKLDKTIQRSLVVIGPNGSGKSTLLAMLAGAFRPAEGLVHFVWEGCSLSPDQWRSRIAWLSPHLYPPLELTVADVIQTYQVCKQVTDSTESLLHGLALSEHRNQALYRLSSGQRQRLLLGLELAVPSPVVFLDEPTAFLDADWQVIFHQRLRDLIPQRLIICATNDPDEAQLFPQKLYLGTYGAAA